MPGVNSGARPRVAVTVKGLSRGHREGLAFSITIDVLGAGDDLMMTNASKSGCLPEQIAYWDAALVPAQVAWIVGGKRGCEGA